MYTMVKNASFTIVLDIFFVIFRRSWAVMYIFSNVSD